MSSQHTCISCRVAFSDPSVQREHYKSDWHRYNLKRKVVQLEPVTAELFNEKVVQHRDIESGSTKPTNDELRCNACSKSFNSMKSLENHEKSKKHLDAINSKPNSRMNSESSDVTKVEESDSSDEEWEEGEGGIGLEECLFCGHVSQDLDTSLEHMSVKHGFFIPDVDFCTDIPAFVLYLGQKVGVGFYCLWCDETGKRFHNLDGVQKHMRDKCHCKLQHEGNAMLEFVDFFDFKSTYPDQENVEDEVDVESLLMDANWQLALPSGSIIGHRSLAKYFNQNLKPSSAIALTESQRRDKIIAQYKSLGWIGARGPAAVKKARDIQFMNRLKSKSFMRLGVKANKMQHHFRRRDICF